MTGWNWLLLVSLLVLGYSLYVYLHLKLKDRS